MEYYKDFEKYLSRYKKAKYFAVIKAGGECLNSLLTDALKQIHGYGLFPIVVHGGGSQIDRDLELRGLASEKINGKRVTDERTLEVVVNTMTRLNNDLVSKLNWKKTIARGLNGIFYAERDDPVYGHVGEVVGLQRDEIEESLDRRRISVVSSLGKDYAGNYLNTNADSAFRFLVRELEPDKVIILLTKGGVYKNGHLVSEMNSKDLDRFLKEGHANGGMIVKLEEIRELLKLGFDVQMTSPLYLIQELFSDAGYGTYLRA